MAFVDIRMPPGWDGIETHSQTLGEVGSWISRWFLCTAYFRIIPGKASRPGSAIPTGSSSSKKPFDTVEVLQLANALTEKWRLLQETRSAMDQLEELVGEAHPAS